MKGERYGIRAPLIGPCEGHCGPKNRGRIKPCYPTASGVWLCHACVQARQATTAARTHARTHAVTDGGIRE